jgi:hypothetical protein
VGFFGLFRVIPTKYASNYYWSLIVPDELEPSTIEFGANSDYGRIKLFFLKDSLWAMSIRYYNFTTADMQKALTERYGNYWERANTGNHFWWITSGKHIILFAESFNFIDDKQLQGILRKIDAITEERQSKIQL